MMNNEVVFWVIYILFEFVYVGFMEVVVWQKFGDKVQVFIVDYVSNDCVQVEVEIVGWIKLIVGLGGWLFGGDFVGVQVGEIINLLLLVFLKKMIMKDFVGFILFYLMFVELVCRVVIFYYVEVLKKFWICSVINMLCKFG